MSIIKINILYLFPGPKYDIEHDFKSRLEALSKYCRGVVLVSGPTAQVKHYGEFTVKPLQAKNKNIFFTIKYMFAALRIALSMKYKKDGLDLLVTYDPLKTGTIGLVLARILGVKLAIEVNGDFNALENYFEVKNESLKKLKRKLYVSVETFNLARADGIKLLYPSQLDFYKKAVTGKVIHVFPAFSDLTPFRNICEEKIVLFAGFPFYIKGLDILIPAFKSVAARFPEWRLKIIGWFPDTSELDAHIGDNKQIEYYRPVPHSEMPEHIGRCGLLVLPSRTETMGRVLLEAMAAGKPRLASNVGGIPTTINDGMDGILFESENIAQLADCLELLMGDKKLRHELGSVGEKRARSEFSLENYASNMHKFFTNILNN